MAAPKSRPFTMPTYEQLKTITDDLVVKPERLRFTPSEPKDDYTLELSKEAREQAQADYHEHDKTLSSQAKRDRTAAARHQAASLANDVLHGELGDIETGLWYLVTTVLQNKSYTWTKELLDDLYAIFHDAWRKMPRRNETERVAATAVILIVIELFDMLFPVHANGPQPQDKVRNENLKRRWIQWNSLPAITQVRLTA